MGGNEEERGRQIENEELRMMNEKLGTERFYPEETLVEKVQSGVFGTCLATGERARWERYDVLGEIKPECMPDWAKKALVKIKQQEKEKKQRNREER